MRNLITDVAGLRVGNAHDAGFASGVTVAVSVSVQGGAPGSRSVPKDALAPRFKGGVPPSTPIWRRCWKALTTGSA